jgi:hypothetical protein
MKNHWLGGLTLGELAHKIWLEISDKREIRASE